MPEALKTVLPSKMPRISKPKTLKELAAIKQHGQFPVGGVEGLYLLVSPAGNKTYGLRYTVPGSKKRTIMGLGSFDLKSLSDVRRQALVLRQKIEDGIDPMAERAANRQRLAEERAAQAKEEQQKQEKTQHTVEYCINAYLDELSLADYWKHNIRGEMIARSYVRRNVFPIIGDVPIDELTHQQVFDVVRPIWQSQINAAPETLKWIRRAFAWAKAKGWCSGDNPADRSGSLGILLAPLNRNRRKVENLAALSLEEIPSFVASCLQQKSESARMLAFSIVTVLRGKMVRCLKWEHYDEKAETLTIPEALLKTKGRGAHTVYLSSAALELLEEQPRVSQYIFPNPRNSRACMSDNALSYCFHRMHEARKARDGIGWIDPVLTQKKGYPVIATQHGTARAGFKTWCRTGENRQKFDDDAVELCMAHGLQDDYRGAYNRSTLVEERRAVMEAWGRYCLSVHRIVQSHLL